MVKKHLRLAKLLFSVLGQRNSPMTAEVFAYHVSHYRKIDTEMNLIGGAQSVREMLDDVYRLRHAIKAILEAGTAPGPHVLIVAKVLHEQFPTENLFMDVLVSTLDDRTSAKLPGYPFDERTASKSNHLPAITHPGTPTLQ